MVSMRSIFILALAATGLAAPLNDIEARDTRWTCKNSKGNVVISQNDAESAMHAAPFSDGKTKTSYPHWFRNGFDKQAKRVNGITPITFGVSECDRISLGKTPALHHETGSAKNDLYLLEFPVFADKHVYKYDTLPKEDPGAARVIFTWPSKTFCGIVGHTNGNQGNLVLCEH